MLPVPMEDILSSSVLLSGFCYALLLFTITSWILHYFPHLLHSSKRKGEDSKLDPRFSVVNIAHRGSRLEGEQHWQDMRNLHLHRNTTVSW